MNSKDQAKRLKAFAKRRQSRSEATVPPENNDREKQRSQCLEVVTSAILNLRRQDSKLRDVVVIEALRYEVREPGAKEPLDNVVYQAIEVARNGITCDIQIWRSALKSLLAMSDPASTQNRNPTQLLDLMETVSQ
jgi:hypothetical protein